MVFLMEEGSYHGEKSMESSRIMTPEENEWKKYKSLSTKELRKLGKQMSVSAAELQWKMSIRTKELLQWKKYMPIGYRFDPSDCQLLKYYLLPRVNGAFFLPGIIEDVDVYRCHPAKLPELNKEEEFSYFFTPRDRRHQSGTRLSRITKDGNGHWKMTSKLTPFRDVDNSDLGRRNTLVYYEKGPSDKDIKTNWIMHEYVLDESLCTPIEIPSTSNTNTPKDIVLCRIYQRKQNQEERRSQSLQIRDITDAETSVDFSKDGNQPRRKLPIIPDLNVQCSCSNNHVSEPESHQEASNSIIYGQELPFSQRKRSRTSGPDDMPCDETSQSQLMVISRAKPIAWKKAGGFLEQKNSMTMTHSNGEKLSIKYPGSPPEKVEHYFVCPNCKGEGGQLTDTQEKKRKSPVIRACESEGEAKQNSLIGRPITNDDKKSREFQIFGRVQSITVRGAPLSGYGSSSSSSSS